MLDQLENKEKLDHEDQKETMASQDIQVKLDPPEQLVDKVTKVPVVSKEPKETKVSKVTVDTQVSQEFEVHLENQVNVVWMD